MLLTCVTACAASCTAFVPSKVFPSNNRIVAVTAVPLGLYTPTLVRELPLTRLVNTPTTDAALDGNPGTNIPTCPPLGRGHLSWDAPPICPAAPSVVNSTAPRLCGLENRLTQMSSNPRASRGPN